MSSSIASVREAGECHCAKFFGATTFVDSAIVYIVDVMSNAFVAMNNTVDNTEPGSKSLSLVLGLCDVLFYT